MKIEIQEIKENNIFDALYFGECPEIGRRYFLEDATNGTSSQNKMFHLLVDELFMSGMFSFPCYDKASLKDHIKLKLGEGFEKIIYVTDDGKIKQIKYKDFHTLPRHIRQDKSRCLGKLKSWADYTNKQKSKCIDNLINYMVQCGVNSKRFNEIIEELN